MILRNVTLQGKSIDFANGRDHEDNNVITILSGNNGSGKSRLLQVICSTFITVSLKSRPRCFFTNIDNFSRLDQLENLSYTIDGVYFSISSSLDKNDISSARERNVHASLGERNYDLGLKIINSTSKNLIEPSKVIAVTSSPYDKFPFLSASEDLSPYIYLGSRGVSSYTRDRTYLRYKFDQLGFSLIKLLIKPIHGKFDLSNVLNFLNFSNSFTLKLSINKGVLEGGNSITPERILNLVRKVRHGKEKSYRQFNFLDDNISEEIYNSLLRVVGEDKLKKIRDIDGFEFEDCEYEFEEHIDLSEFKNKDIYRSLFTLSKYDVLNLDDVIFTKSNSSQKFLLSEASTGELNLIFTISSISGEIEDNSLILIDEPELSLHPEWQINFLSLLKSAFCKYKKCHFIIATHSPSITSSIPDNNAYIVSLGSGDAKLMTSDKYHSRSADFLLAKVFNSPGNSNEYLIKTAINIFFKVKENKCFDENDLENLKLLNDIVNYLPEEDPVLELIEMINEVYVKYGRY